MDFSPNGPAAFAAAVTARSAAVGALAFSALYLAQTHQLYATSVVLIGLALLVGVDLARSVGSADRLLAQFVDGLIAEGYERPTGRVLGARRLEAAIGRAMAALDRARAERQRRVDYLQALVDNVQAAILVLDDAGQVEFSNRAARRRFGEAGGPLNALPSLASVAAALASARPGAREIHSLADGTRVLASVAGFSAGTGGQKRLVSLQSLAGDLDPVELNAQQDLIRILAHEMMNSLTPVCSLAESLAERSADPEVVEALQVIARRGEGLMRFVDRYRRLADLPPAAKTPLRHDQIVERVHGLVALQMSEAGVAFSARVELGARAVEADPELIDQALINLLKNAREAVWGAPDAAVELRVEDAGEAVAITVEDNGPGMTPQAVESAFTPFYTTKPDGSGIGLTLARQIALAHGGRLEYVPISRGAAFRLLLPKAEGQPRPPR